MTVERTHVEAMARLAQLDVDEAEAERLAAEMTRILEHADRLRALPVTGGPVTGGAEGAEGAERAERAHGGSAGQSAASEGGLDRGQAGPGSPGEPAPQSRAADTVADTDTVAAAAPVADAAADTDTAAADTHAADPAADTDADTAAAAADTDAAAGVEGRDPLLRQPADFAPRFEDGFFVVPPPPGVTPAGDASPDD